MSDNTWKQASLKRESIQQAQPQISTEVFDTEKEDAGKRLF